MKEKITQNAPHSAVYGLGPIGAAVYYIGTGFRMGVLGVLSRPAFLVYEAR